MVFKPKIKAGSLSFVIIISLLLLSLCSMLVLFYLLNYKVFITELQHRKNMDNIESALNIVMNSPEFDNQFGTFPIEIFDNSPDSIYATQKRWGFFDLITIETGNKRVKLNKTALIGANYKTNALFLASNNNYLYLSGKTLIKGDCYIPGGIAKSGSFNGEQFIGDRLIDGKQYKSTSIVQEVFYKENIDFADSVVVIENLKTTKELNNPFKNKTLTIYSDKDIFLSNCSISGNILIKSKGTVEMDSSCQVKDIIVSASSIKLNSYFKGSFQAFALDSIVLGKNCCLMFPSVLGIVGSKQKQLISIGEKSVVHGAVVLYSLNRLNTNSKVFISKSSRVNGLVYSNCKVEHQGKVIGSIYCNEFVLSSGFSEYINYLYNSEINSEDLDSNFVYPLIFENVESKQIVEWLN